MMDRTRILCFAVAVAVVMVSSAVSNAQDEPTGGGYGCLPNGNCQTSSYKDKTKKDSWWYPLCSGCHNMPRPAGAVTASEAALAPVLAKPGAFWTFHNTAKRDPGVQRYRGDFSTIVAARQLSRPFRVLMTSKPK